MSICAVRNFGEGFLREFYGMVGAHDLSWLRRSVLDQEGFETKQL